MTRMQWRCSRSAFASLSRILLFMLIFFSLSIIVSARPPAAQLPADDERSNRVDDDNDAQVPAPKKAIKKQPGLAMRPDHLEAVPLERDGGLNKDFRQEILLGKDSQDFKVDSDGTARRHDDTWGKDCVVAFAYIITWDEYHYHFLVDNKLMDEKKARHHDEKEHDGLDEDTKFRKEDEKTAFERADGQKNRLDETEWLSFRHPEHSSVMLKDMADEILKALDRDGDGALSEEEFAAPAPGVVNEAMQAQEKAYVDDRRKEFKMSIDTDGNGKASAKELFEYVNPRNPLHAKQEVTEIMAIADEDRDGLLTLDELLAQKGEKRLPQSQ